MKVVFFNPKPDSILFIRKQLIWVKWVKSIRCYLILNVWFTRILSPWRCLHSAWCRKIQRRTKSHYHRNESDHCTFDWYEIKTRKRGPFNAVKNQKQTPLHEKGLQKVKPWMKRYSIDTMLKTFAQRTPNPLSLAPIIPLLDVTFRIECELVDTFTYFWSVSPCLIVINNNPIMIYTKIFPYEFKFSYTTKRLESRFYNERVALVSPDPFGELKDGQCVENKVCVTFENLKSKFFV